MAGFQGAVVTAYGSDGNVLGRLTVTDPACKSAVISPLDRKPEFISVCMCMREREFLHALLFSL